MPYLSSHSYREENEEINDENFPADGNVEDLKECSEQCNEKSFC